MKTEILGIDLSKHRNDLTQDEFLHLHEKGVRFLFTRISSDYSGADPTAQRYLRWAGMLGWVTGGYHFLDRNKDRSDKPTWDGVRQANMYATAQEAIIGNGVECDLDFVDVEAQGIPYNMVLSYVNEMRILGYESVGLYTRLSYWNAKFGDQPNPTDFSWLADYRGGSRWLNNWQTSEEDEQWRPSRLWQFGPLRYRYEGKNRSIDGNVFQGTQVELLELAEKITNR